MTSKQMWTKLSAIVNEVLNEKLDQDDVDAVMTCWNEHRNEVTKLLAGETATKGKLKDPKHPKRPLSSYMFFCKDYRDKARAKLPDGAPTTDVSKQLGAMWKTFSDKKKAKYVKQANEDKERYKSEMENYTPTPQEELQAKAATKGGRRKKDPNAPKRPLSAYMFFAQKERPAVKQDDSLSFVEITKEIGRRWNDLSDEEKRPFEEMNAQDKERYEREKAAYDAGETVVKEQPKAKAKAKAQPAKVKAKAKAQPKAKAKAIKKTPGYELYVNEQRGQLEEDHPEWNARRMTTEINKGWRELEDEDRDAYEEEAANPEEDEEDEELESEESESELVEEEV